MGALRGGRYESKKTKLVIPLDYLRNGEGRIEDLYMSELENQWV